MSKKGSNRTKVKIKDSNIENGEKKKSNRAGTGRKGLDLKDQRIIEILRENPRTPAEKIAPLVHLSRIGVRKRLIRMEQLKLIKHTVVTIYSLDYGCILTIHLTNSVDNNIDLIIGFLKEKEEVKLIFRNTEGEKTDIICVVFAESNEELGNLFKEIIEYSYITKIDLQKINHIDKMIS
jgi:DNA-binding Lrp family transcriptional regulator